MANTAKRKFPPDCRVRLGADLVIGAAADLHAQLGEALQQPAPVVLDAGAVARLDTAGLQLLEAFVAARESAARAWRWENAGPVLRDAAAQLGMQDMLKLAKPAAIN